MIAMHLLPGRQRLIEFGPLFYPEYLFYLLSLRLQNLLEILCTIAQKRLRPRTWLLNSVSIRVGNT